MKSDTILALDNLARSLEQVASLLLPNCVSNLDTESVIQLRQSADEVREAMRAEHDAQQATRGWNCIEADDVSQAFKANAPLFGMLDAITSGGKAGR